MLSKAVTRYPTLHMLVRKLHGKCVRHPTMLLFSVAFCEVHSAPEEITDDVYSALERFAILMHDRTRTSVSRNETRKPLIHAKGASNGSSSSIGGCATPAHRKYSATRGHDCTWVPPPSHRLRGRVVKGVGHLDHVWSYGVREVVSSIPDRSNIVGWVFHPDQVTGNVFSSENALPSKFWIYLEHCPRGEAVIIGRLRLSSMR